jgi:hypothetical protein
MAEIRPKNGQIFVAIDLLIIIFTIFCPEYRPTYFTFGRVGIAILPRIAILKLVCIVHVLQESGIPKQLIITHKILKTSVKNVHC